MLLTKTQRSEVNFADNHFHNILRLFDVLLNFLFTTSETRRDYYKHDIYELSHELPDNLRLRVLGTYETLEKS